MAGNVSGYVATPDGASVGDASVFIAGGEGPTPDIAAVSGDDGSFALDGLPAGTYLLRALGPGGEVGQVSVVIRDGATSKVRIVVGNGKHATALDY